MCYISNRILLFLIQIYAVEKYMVYWKFRCHSTEIINKNLQLSCSIRAVQNFRSKCFTKCAKVSFCNAKTNPICKSKLLIQYTQSALRLVQVPRFVILSLSKRPTRCAAEIHFCAPFASLRFECARFYHLHFDIRKVWLLARHSILHDLQLTSQTAR